MRIISKSKPLLDSLEKQKISTAEELIEFLPFRYENYSYTDESKIKDSQKVVLLGKLVSNPKLVRAKRLTIISFNFISVDNKLYLVKIFNRDFIMNYLNFHDSFTIVGNYDQKKKELIAQNIIKGEIPYNKRIKPVYHLKDNVSSQTFSAVLKRCYDGLNGLVKNKVPEYFMKKYQLLDHYNSLKLCHFPENLDDPIKGLRTLKYEECLEYCTKNAIIRQKNSLLVNLEKVVIDKIKINEFIKKLPYKLSKDQINAIKEIILDMDQNKLMYRLLQGDVGTGKTIVAFICLYANYLRGNIGTLMVPTDSLARQHYLNAIELFAEEGIKVELLIGSLKAKEKKEIKEKLLTGQVDILIGTHALFVDDVIYPNLGLAIIDEQHRFGVNQRNYLTQKGDGADLLLMSATPIPRTLSLTLFGDLDITTLKEYPFDKKRVETFVLGYNDSRIIEEINNMIKSGRRVFIVAPKINIGNYKTMSAEYIYNQLSELYLDKVSLLHGRMKNDEKINVLENFRTGLSPVLVSTTVIELGIDIKNAGLMIIYSANSFGLASLHQLRGRVGRDGKEAKCFLLEDLDDPDFDPSRLNFLASHYDGFEISEEDMRLRGPGDFIGLSQSGFPTFACVNLISDFKMFQVARLDADYILNNLDDEEMRKYYQEMMLKITQTEKELTLFD